MIAKGSFIFKSLDLSGLRDWLISDIVLAFVFRGPPRSDGDRPRFGDRDGYRGGPRGGDEKGGAPADFQPSFQVNLRLTNHS